MSDRDRSGVEISPLRKRDLVWIDRERRGEMERSGEVGSGSAKDDMGWVLDEKCIFNVVHVSYFIFLTFIMRRNSNSFSFSFATLAHVHLSVRTDNLPCVDRKLEST
jgi:hypothetical protein